MVEVVNYIIPVTESVDGRSSVSGFQVMTMMYMENPLLVHLHGLVRLAWIYSSSDEGIYLRRGSERVFSDLLRCWC